ncbi:MAG: 30S ribosomal protein S15 [Endomicrobium sp.]|jgi:small subunit ribosomal protein S15|nr:30S ribosomal protein S15 [Endomicrobium sp.]
MVFVKKEVKEVVEKFKTHETDTGSSQVQVALLTTRIKYLSDHFQRFPKDFASKVGFIKMIGQRRRLLNYLKKHSKESYSSLIKKLDLRK